MAYEIEMLAVGAADAMIIRYLNDADQEVVILIDAGNRKDGEQVVRAINKWTKQKYVDLAISTHPDNDHIGGFSYVIDHLDIEEFWIHDPNKHALNSKKLLESIDAKDLRKSLQYVTESLDNSVNLLAKIDSKGIRRDREPFAGLNYEYAPIKVVGPSLNYYESLLKNFRDFADLGELALILNEENDLEKSHRGGALSAGSLTSQQVLDKDNDRSNENNSSVILLFEPEDKRYLFTSDAGPTALKKAHGIYDISNIYWLDVPHHGSRYNLTTELIDTFNPKVAFISCDGSEHYPNPAVVEELKKKGRLVYSTANGSKIHSHGIPIREGYSKATPL